ncbi:MAG: hypothetical protein GY877_11650 [Hyphomicrobium sp.]|nr:hypothetical protein [Candidatus Brocadiaceae bacterium]MCP4781359.1 hypothetical protein [Hyphomicrobium sp.]
MNENKFNNNFETSRRLGSVTEEFGKDLLYLTKSTCRARLSGMPSWKVDIVISDAVMKCLELFNGVNYKLRNPIDYFHTAIDNFTIDFLRQVYEDGTRDVYGCSLVINKNNGRGNSKTLVAKQINENNEFNF